MEHRIIPVLGEAMGMICKEQSDEIKRLQDRVAKLERKLEQARVDGVVTLPRSGNNAA